MNALAPNSYPTVLDGKIVTPDDQRYRLLSSTYTSVNSPAMVVLVQSADDIRAALQLAQDMSLKLSVRSGGHSLAGLSSNDGGMVIDLSRMNEVEVIDPGARLVRVQAGARWGAIAEKLNPFGLAISSGNYGAVGAGGLATAGGIGWMVRKHGLTIDHMRAATIVLADGSEITATASKNPDLFWAIRGAGGLMGVVTEFVFEAQPVTAVGYSQLNVELDASTNPLTQFGQYMRNAPRELAAEMLISGHNASITTVYSDDDGAAAARALAPLLQLGTVRARTGIQFVPYAALVPRHHEHPNLGQQKAITHNGMIDVMTPDIERRVHAAAESGIMMQVRSLGGAMSDVEPGATAFANRQQLALVIATVFSPAERRMMDEHWRPMQHDFTGAYANFEATPTARTISLAFPTATFDRIIALKRQYDPEAIFYRWPN